jgi:hypothetical protein
MMGAGQYWHMVEQKEETGSTTPWRADESGRSCCIWPKTPKNIKKTRKKQVERGGGD